MQKRNEQASAASQTDTTVEDVRSRAQKTTVFGESGPIAFMPSSTGFMEFLVPNTTSPGISTLFQVEITAHSQRATQGVGPIWTSTNLFSIFERVSVFRSEGFERVNMGPIRDSMGPMLIEISSITNASILTELGCEDSSIPSHLMCPMTQAIFTDPVKCDAKSLPPVERKAIEELLCRKKNNPFNNGTPLASAELTPCKELKQEADDFVEQQRAVLQRPC